MHHFSHIFRPDSPVESGGFATTKARGNATRHDTTHPHILTPEFLHQSVIHAIQSELRCVIRSPARKPVFTCQATNIDDMSSFLCFESEQSFTRAVEGPTEICFNRRPPLFRSEVTQRTEQSRAGIVDQNIEPSEVLVHEAEEIFNLFMLGHIGSFAPHFTAPLGLDLAHSSVDLLLTPPANRHGSSLRQQLLGYRSSNSACS